MEITIKKDQQEYKLWLDFADWQAHKIWLEYREFCYWKYFGTGKEVIEEDSFENWKLRGCPSPKLFDRA